MTRSGRLYQRRRSLGQCTRCRRPVASVGGVGPERCAECLDQRRVNTRASHATVRQQRQAREVCRDCEGAVTETNPVTRLPYLRCRSCRLAQAGAKQLYREVVQTFLHADREEVA